MDNPFKNMSKPQVYASLAGFTAITGFLVYRHHASTGSWNPWASSTSASTSSTTSTTVTDPVTGLPYSQDDATDPVTNLPYLAEAEEYGSVQAAEADVSQFGTSVSTGSGVGVSPATGDGTETTPTGAVTSPTYTSNAAWSTAAQAGLTDIGYDGETVGAALGLYLTGQPVTSAQASIVNTALAEFGPPPVGTFQVILAPKTPAGPTMVTVPKVTGQPQEAAYALISEAGLKPSGSPTVKGKTLYVQTQSPAAGAKATKGSTVKLVSKVKE